MAIRLREVNGKVIALCAAKSNPKPNDKYLDDTEHHALTKKFERDFIKMGFMKDYTDNELAKLRSK